MTEAASLEISSLLSWPMTSRATGKNVVRLVFGPLSMHPPEISRLRPRNSVVGAFVLDACLRPSQFAVILPPPHAPFVCLAQFSPCPAVLLP